MTLPQTSVLRNPASITLLCAVLAWMTPIQAAANLEKEILHLLPTPDALMEHHREIGLSDAQRQTITETIGAAQGEILNLEWQLKDASGELVEALRSRERGADAILDLADRVMRIESEIKKTRLRLLLRIRDELSPEQHQKLRELSRGGR